MGTEAVARRYRGLYARLIRLYPRGFRERFGAEMEQVFGDLCRERAATGRGLHGEMAWICMETSAGIVRENMAQWNEMGRTVTRVAAGSLGVLMVPLVASMLIPDWHWGVGGFVFAYVLFFLTGMAYALIARRMGGWAYKAGVGLALAAGFGLGWSNMVHVADSENPANLVYFGVLVVGLAGAWLARLKAPGLAWTLFAMAGVLGVIAVLLPSGAPPEMARRMAVGHGVLVVLFAAAGLLFRRATVAGAR